YPLDETALLDLKDVAKAVGIGFIGTEEAEVLLLLVLSINVAQHTPEHTGRFVVFTARLLNRNSITGKIWNIEVHSELATVGMWVGSHAPLAFRSQLSQFRKQPSMLIEDLLRVVVFHPFGEYSPVLRVGTHLCYRHLVRPECAFYLHTIHH